MAGLVGMKQIAQYMGLSDATILDLIRLENFPAKQTRGAAGIWISDTEEIDVWRKGFVRERGKGKVLKVNNAESAKENRRE